MKRLTIYAVSFLFLSQPVVADHILTSGSNDTGANGGQSVIRYTDDFQIVWERSPAKGTAETQVFAVEINQAAVYPGDILEFQYSGIRRRG